MGKCLSTGPKTDTVNAVNAVTVLSAGATGMTDHPSIALRKSEDHQPSISYSSDTTSGNNAGHADDDEKKKTSLPEHVLRGEGSSAGSLPPAPPPSLRIPTSPRTPTLSPRRTAAANRFSAYASTCDHPPPMTPASTRTPMPSPSTDLEAGPATVAHSTTYSTYSASFMIGLTPRSPRLLLPPLSPVSPDSSGVATSGLQQQSIHEAFTSSPRPLTASSPRSPRCVYRPTPAPQTPRSPRLQGYAHVGGHPAPAPPSPSKMPPLPPAPTSPLQGLSSTSTTTTMTTTTTSSTSTSMRRGSLFVHLDPSMTSTTTTTTMGHPQLSPTLVTTTTSPSTSRRRHQRIQEWPIPRSVASP